MNAFADGQAVEARGMVLLAPFLRERSDGQLVLLDKGPLAKALQETLGDAIFTAKDGSARSVEVKVEERHTGNLFLETWSNRNLDDRLNHISLGSNVGWMFKSRADLLLYYFLENDHLYVLSLWALKRWAFCSQNQMGTCGRVWEYREVEQGKRSQPNDTRGRIVPLEALLRDVGYRLFHPRQFELFNGYDPKNDLAGSLDVGYAAIRARMAQGGPGWTT